MFLTWTIEDYEAGGQAFAAAAAAGGGYAPEALLDAAGALDGGTAATASAAIEAAEAAAWARHTAEVEAAIDRAHAAAWAEAEAEGSVPSESELRDLAVSASGRRGPGPARFDRWSRGDVLRAVAYGTGASRAIAWLRYDADGAVRVARVGVEVDGSGAATGLWSARVRAVEAVLGRRADVCDVWGITPWTSAAAHAEMLAELRATLARAQGMVAPPGRSSASWRASTTRPS